MGKKCFWLSIFGSEIIPKRYLSQNRLSQALAIAKGSTLWLQVLRRMFLPSYTQNTTLFAELYGKKCHLVRAAMLGLVFTGDCLVYYVRSLSSLTPTRKKNKLPQRFAQKIKKRVASRSLRSLEKNRSFLDFYRGSPRKNRKKSSRARASRAHKFCFLYAKTCRVFRTNLAFLS